ncbi:MAG TPA: hypothetical protein VFS12_05850, partial [Terriglobia bacterium]|nr:hypothetical protein [Terriglobia bacterium]
MTKPSVSPRAASHPTSLSAQMRRCIRSTNCDGMAKPKLVPRTCARETNRVIIVVVGTDQPREIADFLLPCWEG